MRKKIGACGFTILEVAIAVVVLGTALVAIARMFQLGSAVTQSDRMQVVALNLLARDAELLKERDFSSIASESRRALDDYGTYEVETTVTDIDSNFKQATVTIYWNNVMGGEASQSVNLLKGASDVPVSNVSWLLTALFLAAG